MYSDWCSCTVRRLWELPAPSHLSPRRLQGRNRARCLVVTQQPQQQDGRLSADAWDADISSAFLSWLFHLSPFISCPIPAVNFLHFNFTLLYYPSAPLFFIFFLLLFHLISTHFSFPYLFLHLVLVLILFFSFHCILQCIILSFLSFPLFPVLSLF